MARPRKDITVEQVAQVEKLAAVLSLDQIADFLGMSPRTLDRRLVDDARVATAYSRGRAASIAGVATNLLKQARDGNTTAAIFYLKTQAGWKETTALEHSGRAGGPLDMTVRFVDASTND